MDVLLRLYKSSKVVVFLFFFAILITFSEIVAKHFATFVQCVHFLTLKYMSNGICVIPLGTFFPFSQMFKINTIVVSILYRSKYHDTYWIMTEAYHITLCTKVYTP